jgi:hypothetical protein
MERSQLFDLMGELKLYGMKAAFDEIMATAVKRRPEASSAWHSRSPTPPGASPRRPQARRTGLPAVEAPFADPVSAARSAINSPAS